MSSVLILDQMAGPIARDFGEKTSLRCGGCVLVTGHPDASKVLNEWLEVVEVPTYRRGSLLPAHLSYGGSRVVSRFRESRSTRLWSTTSIPTF